MIDCMAYIQSRNWLVTAGRDQCFFVWKFMGSHLIQFAEDYEIEAESENSQENISDNHSRMLKRERCMYDYMHRF